MSSQAFAIRKKSDALENNQSRTVVLAPQERLLKAERTESRLAQGMKADPEDILTKIKIVGTLDAKGKPCQSAKKLAKMRAEMDTAMINQITA